MGAKGQRIRVEIQSKGSGSARSHAKRYLNAVLAFAAKDALLERKSFETLLAAGSFALLVAVLFHFAFDISAAEGPRFFPGALWTAILFSGTIGMARSARSDEEEGRGRGAALVPVDRSAIFLGKCLFHMGLMAVVEAIATPVFIAAFSVREIARPGLMILGLLLGTWGFVALGTLLAGATAAGRGTGLLLPVVLFPLLAPVALGSVAVVSAGVTGEAAAAGSWIRLLAVFDILFTAIPALFYESLTEV